MTSLLLTNSPSYDSVQDADYCRDPLSITADYLALRACTTSRIYFRRTMALALAVKRTQDRLARNLSVVKVASPNIGTRKHNVSSKYEKAMETDRYARHNTRERDHQPNH